MTHDCSAAVEARAKLETAVTPEERFAILFSHRKGKRVPPDAES